jgi:hypothetical protein
MLKSKHHQRHSTYQRRPALSLEVTEAELMARSRPSEGMPRHVPHTVSRAPLSDGRQRVAAHCPAPTTEVPPTPYVATTQAATQPERCNAVVSTHQQHLYSLLMRRLQAACARGDAALVQILQQEAAQLHCVSPSA